MLMLIVASIEGIHQVVLASTGSTIYPKCESKVYNGFKRLNSRNENIMKVSENSQNPSAHSEL